MTGTPVWAQLAYLVAAVCFVLALKGLSSPKHARKGNLLGAFGAVLACVTVFFYAELDHLVWILLAIAVGSVVGAVGAQRVQMTQMPQLVALFNGVGGGAAALVALLELGDIAGAGEEVGGFTLAATAFTIVVGSVSFSGSLVTFAKLQELMTSRPVVFPGLPVAFAAALLGGVVLSVLTVTDPAVPTGVLLALIGLLLGVLLVLPVGGADVPIVISLLNAFTGLTVAAGGYVLDNTVLLVAGTLVGASGTFLTKLMAAAMGRSVGNILFGALKGGSTLGAGVASDRPVRSAGAEDVAILLGYAIHPVAGRMPGHMNVLLAEAQVPYEQLKEMDDINGEFKQTDVVLVVGANDVVNPAAKTTPGAPIYGMPILNADEAQQIVFLKRSMRPGFAGIENELLFDPKTTLLFGDAKDTLGKLLSAVKGL